MDCLASLGSAGRTKAQKTRPMYPCILISYLRPCEPRKNHLFHHTGYLNWHPYNGFLQSPNNCVVKSLKYSKHRVFSDCSCNTPFPIGIVSYKRQPCISQHYLHLIGSWLVNLPSRTKVPPPRNSRDPL